MKKTILFLIFLLAAEGLFLFLNAKNRINITQDIDDNAANLFEATVSQDDLVSPSGDISPQKPLENPPPIIKAVYSTGWSAGNDKKIDYFVNLIKSTELNAIVIDVKDYTGKISYESDLDLLKKYDAIEVKIPKPNVLIKKLHDNGIYAIARIAVFQDLALAKARPDLALQSISKNAVWKDYKGISWMDQTSKEVWDYNIAVAKDALSRGFDEVNFDYIRFASDGNMADIKYPFYDGKTPKRKIMNDFFKYLKENLPNEKISADLFGYVTLHQDDLGIGQHLDDAFPYFDCIAPMVYPSHYNKGFNGYANPADYPYDVVYSSMAKANERLAEFNNSTTTVKMANAEFRPWLQDFDLGADYDAAKVRIQIQAVYDAASTTQAGWMLWNASNIYTKEALLSE